MALTDVTTKLRKLVDLCEEVDALLNELSIDPMLEGNGDWSVEAQALNVGDFADFVRGTAITMISGARGGTAMLQQFIPEEEHA